MNFLPTRTPRERWLIIIGAGITALFVIWQFAVSPVLSGKARAQQSQQTALRDLDIVQRGLPILAKAPAGTRAPFNRAALIAAARSANVAISRVQPGADEALQIWLEDTETPNIYRLLTDLSARFNVTIERVQLTRRESGRVSAQITLAPT